MRLAIAMIDADNALFDAADGFAGCIAGLHDVLRRQSLLESLWDLDPDAAPIPGWANYIDRIYPDYPCLNDQELVAGQRDEWLES